MPDVVLPTLPVILQSLITLGVIAGAIYAIVRLWTTMKPNYMTREEIQEKFATMRDEVSNRIGKVEGQVVNLTQRANQTEKDIAAVDVAQISKRFDRMEDKIDDLTQMLLQHFSLKSKE